MSGPSSLTSRTEDGTEFHAFPFQKEGPAPTLLLLATSGSETLATEPYRRVGALLHASGWNVLSVDLPCHGADRRDGEALGLEGWAARVRAGEDIGVTFAERATDVITHAIHNRLADPDHVAAAGTSRGGYMAFRAAAHCPAIRAVGGFAPVTDLEALTEFGSMSADPRIEALGLEHFCDSLADRAVWLTIGNQDDRVGTDRAVRFALALTDACRRRGVPPRVEVHVLAEPGHASKPEWHTGAAVWFTGGPA